MIKICGISDMHGTLLDIPECDILCICGDILPLSFQHDIDKSIAWLAGPFQKWLLDAPCKHVIMIWGNHDFIGEKYHKNGLEGWEQADLLFQNDLGPDYKIHILQDEAEYINGLKFYGTPWCPNLSNWAFYATSAELKDKFENIPNDVDILLTHCPPKFGQQGIVLQSNNWNYLSDFGCQELQDEIIKKFINKDKKVFVLSGHIHSGNHQFENYENILYKNVSIKDENYEFIYYPKIFTIDA